MLQKAYTYYKEQAIKNAQMKEEEKVGLENIARLPILRTPRELCAILVSKLDATQKKTITMFLNVFAPGNVLYDETGHALYVDRKNIKTILWPDTFGKRTVHAETAEYNIYVPVDANDVADEKELYNLFLTPGLKEKLFDPCVKYITQNIKHIFYGEQQNSLGNSMTK